MNSNKSDNKKINFTTIFFDIKNVNLIKDVGMIPYTMHNTFGYNSCIPLFDNEEYIFKNLYFKDIYTPKLKKFNSKFLDNISCMVWMIFNINSICFLNLFFLNIFTIVEIFIAKILKPNIKIYVHCDSNSEHLLNSKYINKRFWRFIAKLFLNNRILEDVLWDVQDDENFHALRATFPFKNIICVPNGLSFGYDIEVNYESKMNIIIVVGRIGADEKNISLIIEAFLKIHYLIPDWYLYLVGPIEDDYYMDIQRFHNEYSNDFSYIKFLNEITNRNELYKLYNKSKIYCSASLYESFGFSTIEAMSQGCYVIGSDILATKKIINNNEFGTLFKSNDVEDLMVKILETTQNEYLLKSNCEKVVRFTRNKFVWDKVLEPVNNWYMSKV